MYTSLYLLSARYLDLLQLGSYRYLVRVLKVLTETLIVAAAAARLSGEVSVEMGRRCVMPAMEALSR